MNEPTLDCPCTMTTAIVGKHTLEGFAGIREGCPALREILVPDDIWPDFQTLAQEDIDGAMHQFSLLLALERGYLKDITSPVHRYLITNGKPSPRLTMEYRQALKEYWMSEKWLVKRYREHRTYLGKLTELLCAGWIEKRGWKILNLAALGGDADIEAIAPGSENLNYMIEVKHIGQKEDEFWTIVESLSGGDEDERGSFSPYPASNYLLLSVYGAAKQLQELRAQTKALVVFLVISNTALDSVDKSVKGCWMDRQFPKFFDIDPTSTRPAPFMDGWRKFFEEQKKEKRFSSIESDLQVILGSLGEVWIVGEGRVNPFQYSQHYIVDFGVRPPTVRKTS